jgi:hypothetical protein
MGIGLQKGVDKGNLSQTYRQLRIPIKDLDRSRLGWVPDVPMIDRRLGHEAETTLAIPLPKDHVLVHDSGLEFLFDPQIEDLNSSRLCLESDDLLGPVHDSAIGVDGSFDDFIAVFEVNDNDLRLVVLVDLLADANIVVRLQSLAVGQQGHMARKWVKTTHAGVEANRSLLL